ncbi:MAG TPA: hypothetical protein VG603_13430, partial [Chitinophagales bacterium]|nr:hypothetical protein [Chitinophagales bacterium]
PCFYRIRRIDAGVSFNQQQPSCGIFITQLCHHINGSFSFQKAQVANRNNLGVSYYCNRGSDLLLGYWQR